MNFLTFIEEKKKRKKRKTTREYINKDHEKGRNYKKGLQSSNLKDHYKKTSRLQP